MYEHPTTSALAPTREPPGERAALPARSVGSASSASSASSACAARRLVASVVALGAGAILALAAVLDPSPAGLGTHEQLALPSCGWVALANVPCPTCGMTTAFAHAANGDFLASAHTQPAGFLLALATAIAFSGAVYVAVTGERLGWALDRLACARVGWGALAVLLAAWVYKVLSYKGLL